MIVLRDGGLKKLYEWILSALGIGEGLGFIRVGIIEGLDFGGMDGGLRW